MSSLTRRTVLAGLSATVALRATRAFAAWPERNITMLHGFPPGGGIDITTRLIADGLSKRLGRQVVVESRPGAAGNLAAGLMARAEPDGYTLGVIPGGHAVSAATYKSLPYDPIEDFTIIGQVTEFPFVIVTYPDHPIRSVPDLVNAARTSAKPLLGGVPGQGSTPHLILEYLSRLAGISLQAVPFRGGNQSLTDLLGKRLDFLIDPPIALLGQINSGALRAIAVTGANRYGGLPNVGTIAEAGFPGFSITSWTGVVAPAKLPASITARVNAEIAAIVREPDVLERIKKTGSEPKAGSPDEFKKLIATDIARWTKVVADAGIEKVGN